MAAVLLFKALFSSCFAPRPSDILRSESVAVLGRPSDTFLDLLLPSLPTGRVTQAVVRMGIIFHAGD